MLTLNPSDQKIAADLAYAQQQKRVEHYWAINGAGHIYKGSGQPNCIIADQELEAAYDDSTSRLRYHHSHPDERALSPSDLYLLHRKGVQEVWAHSVGGASYGAALTEGTTKDRFKESLQKLHNFMCVQLVNGHDVSCATKVTPQEFELFRDLAACEALETKGLTLSHIRHSDEMRRNYMCNFHKFIAIRSYFESVLT